MQNRLLLRRSPQFRMGMILTKNHCKGVNFSIMPTFLKFCRIFGFFIDFLVLVALFKSPVFVTVTTLVEPLKK